MRKLKDKDINNKLKYLENFKEDYSNEEHQVWFRLYCLFEIKWFSIRTSLIITNKEMKEKSRWLKKWRMEKK